MDTDLHFFIFVRVATIPANYVHGDSLPLSEKYYSLLHRIPPVSLIDVDFFDHCGGFLVPTLYNVCPGVCTFCGQGVQPRVVHAFGPVSHIIIATPTAPPTTSASSLHHPLVMGASPVCRPGLPEDDPVVATPAVPVGVSAAPPPTPTTVTAVTMDWLPSGRVLVFTTVLVEEEDAALPLDVVELPDEGVMVCTPPPTVDTTVRPTLLVLVMAWPRVREVEEEAVVVGDSPAEVELDVVEPEPGLATTAPLDVVEDVAPAPADVVLVLEGAPPP